MIVSRTPFRISIGGGGTDLPFYFKKKGGELVTAAIDKYMYIIVQPRQFDEFLIRYSKTEIVKNVDDIQHELIREALKLLNITKPLEITSVSDLPAKTGLGSSSTFLVGLLHALHEYKGEKVSKKRLAEEATKIQTEILQQAAGMQDQYIASYGGMINLRINVKGKVIVTPIDITDENLNELEEKLVFFYTGVRRSADEVLKDQEKEVLSDDVKMDSLTQIKEIGFEIKDALESGNLRKFGQYMHLHWKLKTSLSNKMTNLQINEWYELARSNGAIGGKIIGAGGGGFLMFYVENNKERLIDVMTREGLSYLKFGFDYDGTQIIVNGR
jgi:D-glycero-alpha-D-manno-heptose-7-phosphate kinase